MNLKEFYATYEGRPHYKTWQMIGFALREYPEKKVTEQDLYLYLAYELELIEKNFMTFTQYMKVLMKKGLIDYTDKTKMAIRHDEFKETKVSRQTGTFIDNEYEINK